MVYKKVTEPLLATIINYKFNAQAISLKKELQKFIDTIAIDSGSGLNHDEQQYFDISLKNVFYSGMINALDRYLKLYPNKYEIIYVIASDVEINNPEQLIIQAQEAFKNPKIGVYAPSVCEKGSPHPQMINKNSLRLRQAVFIDGYCFAVRRKLLEELCPIETSINYIGWGIDVYLSYLAIKKGLITVVDDGVTVFHRPSLNQEFRSSAKIQRDKWYQNLDKKARLHRSVTAIEFLKNEFGASLISSLPWK